VLQRRFQRFTIRPHWGTGAEAPESSKGRQR
jgi:hypothetical protein